MQRRLREGLLLAVRILRQRQSSKLVNLEQRGSSNYRSASHDEVCFAKMAVSTALIRPAYWSSGIEAVIGMLVIR
jgi:hypothetical protein